VPVGLGRRSRCRGLAVPEQFRRFPKCLLSTSPPTAYDLCDPETTAVVLGKRDFLASRMAP